MKCCCSEYRVHTESLYTVHNIMHVYMICILPSGLGISTDIFDTPGMRSLIAACE